MEFTQAVRDDLEEYVGKRLVPFLILSVLTVFAVIYDPLCGLFATVLIIGGLYEFFYMVEKKGVRLFKPLGLLV